MCLYRATYLIVVFNFFAFVSYTNTLLFPLRCRLFPSLLGDKCHHNKLTMDSFYSLLVINPKSRARTCNQQCFCLHIKVVLTLFALPFKLSLDNLHFSMQVVLPTQYERRFHRRNHWADWI